MKKNNHVRFVRNIPAKLAKAKAPILGTVVSLIGKESAVVKPKGKHFTVVMEIKDLEKIPTREYSKKQKNPNVDSALRNLKKAGLVKEIKKEVIKPTVPFCKQQEAEMTKSFITKSAEVTMDGARTVVTPEPKIMEEQDRPTTQDEMDLLEEQKAGGIFMWIVIIVSLIILGTAVAFSLCK